MRFGNSFEDETTSISEINTTPLVDVMLVLLIIFIITIPVINHSVKIDLPRASNQPNQVKPETINIAIDNDGRIYWNAFQIDEDAMSTHRGSGKPGSAARAAPARRSKDVLRARRARDGYRAGSRTRKDRIHHGAHSMSHSKNRIPAGPPGKSDAHAGVPADIAPIQSASLLQGRDAIAIEHNGRLYLLRQTKQGKLILTK